MLKSLFCFNSLQTQFYERMHYNDNYERHPERTQHCSGRRLWQVPRHLASARQAVYPHAGGDNVPLEITKQFLGSPPRPWGQLRNAPRWQ